jgi:predicted nucleic acid-binding protein
MIAVDSNILIDFIGNDPGAADAADQALRRALASGPVVACEVVLAEVVAGLGNGSAVMDALEGLGVDFSPLEQRSAVRAGEMQRRYLERRRAAAAPAQRKSTKIGRNRNNPTSARVNGSPVLAYSIQPTATVSI